MPGDSIMAPTASTAAVMKAPRAIARTLWRRRIAVRFPGALGLITRVPSAIADERLSGVSESELLQREARRERVLGVEHVLGAAGDPGASGDLRHDPAVRLGHQAPDEARADDRLVDERLAERQLPPGVQLCHPRRGAG